MGAEHSTTTRRQRAPERRRGIRQVLQELAAQLHSTPQPDLRGCLMEAAARAYGYERVHLQEAQAVRAAGVVRQGGPWRGDVPGAGVVLSCDRPGPPADAWEEDQLRALTDLASLVLELERRRGPSARVTAPRHQPLLVGTSEAMTAVRARIAQVGRTPFPVLVLGESGVGKEVVARLVHEHSRRARGPFVAVNCAAIVETLMEAELFGIEDRTATGVRGRRGRFEQAHGGTLFLDEIGDLAPSAQAKLLRVLQDLSVERVGGHASIPVDVRVVAATNRDLPRLVSQGTFRADLYYRLNGVEIEVPPLRARLEDLPLLVAHVLSRHEVLGAVRLTDDVYAALLEYEWPGNVRELERVVERALALCEDGVVTLDHLPPAIASPFVEVFAPALRGAETLRSFAARYVQLVVQRTGNRREACRVLDISYHTLRAYLEQPEAGWGRGVRTRLAPPVRRPRVSLVADHAGPSPDAGSAGGGFLDPAGGA